MKKFLILILFFGLFFSACSNNPFIKNNDPKDIIAGSGLKVDLEVDDEWVPEISYDLELVGDGKEIIVLKKENVILSTSSKKQDGSIVFTQESVDKFYSEFFEDGDLELAYGQKKVFKGILQIDDEFYQNLNADSFEYSLTIPYEYKTILENNVVLNLKEKTLTYDKDGQAAPVQITDIELYPRSNDDFRILYYIKDKGQTSGKVSVKIDEFQFKFGAEDISDSCKVHKDDEGKTPVNMNNIKLSKSQDVLIFSCILPIENYPLDSVNTDTSGYLKYVYTGLFDGKIILPDKRVKAFE
ncbi:MAG: hypothetical protein KC550_01585 [Nanoarchaeota archaeon]|nr:hypothetical protein [Nanoarchaeota archaeon]